MNYKNISNFSQCVPSSKPMVAKENVKTSQGGSGMDLIHRWLSLIALTGILLTGCSTRYGTLTMATTKNIQMDNVRLELVKENVSGKSTKPIVLIIPTGTPSIEDAIDAALEANGGDLLQNVVIYYKWFYIPYIYGENTFDVKGDVWKVVDISTQSAPTSSLDSQGKIFKNIGTDDQLDLVSITN